MVVYMRIQIKKLLQNLRLWVSHTVSRYWQADIFSSLVVTATVMALA